MLDTVRKAAQLAGGVHALAQRIGVSRQALYQWRRRMPAERVLAVERATAGRISRHALRPDLYPEAPESVPDRDAR